MLDFEKLKTKSKLSSDSNVWYQIPEWYAGTWKTESRTQYFEQDLVSGAKSFSDESHVNINQNTHGQLKDNQGNIWSICRENYTSTVKADNNLTVVALIRHSEPVFISNERIVVVALETIVSIEDAGSVIQTAVQREEINTLVPEGKHLLNGDVSIKIFDAEGRPIHLGKSRFLETKIAEFVPVDRLDGKDLHALFKAFLLTRSEPKSDSSI